MAQPCLVTELSSFADVVSLTSHHLLMGQPTSTDAEGSPIDGGDDGPTCCCVPLQPAVVYMNKPKALVTLAYNMVVCSSILVNRLTRQFEGGCREVYRRG